MFVRDLPPLHFLPAFEAAGRLGSFKAAALELSLTPSAISQQIKMLEQSLGVALFERRTRAVVLTTDGRSLHEDVRRILSDVASACRRTRRRVQGQSLRLSTIDYLAYEFLLPRLSAFRQRFADVELSLETSMQLVDFDSSEIDAAIRVGGGPWPSLVWQPFALSTVAVVCSSALARKVKQPIQLFEHPLIELRGQEHRGWTALLKAHGVAAASARIDTFNSYFETLLAAEQGLGMALALFPMTTAWVTSGRLSVPLPTRMRLPGHVSLVYRASDSRGAFYEDFATWLQEQYAQLAALPNGRIVRAAAAGRPTHGRSK